MLCRNKLHPKFGPGDCRECARACERRYNASAKGKQRTAFQSRIKRKLQAHVPKMKAGHQRRYYWLHHAEILARRKAERDAARAAFPGVECEYAMGLLRQMREAV
jgi:hypothetical protein